jgi:hypothetical protein
MIQDALCILSDDQDLAQNTGNYLGDKSYDTGAAGTPDNAVAFGGTVALKNDPAQGAPLPLDIQVTETFTSDGAATVQFQAVEADNDVLTSNLTVLAETPAIGYATLVAGYQPHINHFPRGAKRYKGVRYVIAGAATTAGAVTASVASLQPSSAP